MNKLTLIWTLGLAVPVGVAALATGYVYRETGQLPFQQTDKTVTAPAGQAKADKTPEMASTPEAAPVADESVAIADPEDTGIAADAGSDGKPSFDVVGVEPTGETVVAGRSDAGAIVALVANGKIVGKSIANESGEWTIILNEPLKPGDYDVGLEVHDQNGSPVAESEERIVVSLPEGGKEQPLVVLNSPEGPSNILQKPEVETPEIAVAQAPAVKKGTGSETPESGAAAASESEKIVATVETAAAQAEQTLLDEIPVETAANSATETEESTPEAVVEASESGAPSAANESLSAVASTDEKNSAETVVATIDPAAETTSEPQSAPKTDAVVAKPAEKPGESVTEARAKASVPDETAGEAAQLSNPAQTVTVEAVESEKDKVFVAGTGEPGSSVRVYVGEDYQGEAKVDTSGKWLVQGTKNVAEGNVEVRADLIGKDGNKVDARAAVTFEKEQDSQIVLTKVVASGTGGGTDGQGAQVQKSLPVVIIRKGDNLWRISRRLYGDGVRFTTIYQANREQIRNPDLIYPGQVFLTPEGDLNWNPSTAENGSNG